jgi:hypothetical protein
VHDERANWPCKALVQFMFGVTRTGLEFVLLKICQGASLVLVFFLCMLR